MWDSRAIFALIAFFLHGYRTTLKTTCDFIATPWAKAWSALLLKCVKAFNCFVAHWIEQQSVLDVPQSNIWWLNEQLS